MTRRRKGFFWVSLSILLQTAAGVCAKNAAIVSHGEGVAAMVLNEWYAIELVSLFLQACCWAMALRYLALSTAYPITSLVIILNLLAAWLVFGEAITRNQAIGTALITVGVGVVSGKVEP